MLVRTVSRLHVALIDMNGGLGRVDGGLGLALNEPAVEVEAEPSDTLEASGPMSDRVREAAARVVEEVRGDPVRLRVTRGYPQHVGLGSGTQASLAAGTAASLLNDEELSVREVARITGRGGTSGIGVAAFEAGGFILDGGHRWEEKEGFLPSSSSPAPPPPVLSRLTFPDWEVAVLVPEGTGAHGAREASIFEEQCPVPAGEVERLSRLSLMKLLPSVAEADFPAFRDAISEVQELGFKRRELDLKPESTRLVEEMHARGCAAGMSSFGPAVYAVHPVEVSTDGFNGNVFRTRASNTGAEVVP